MPQKMYFRVYLSLGTLRTSFWEQTKSRQLQIGSEGWRPAFAVSVLMLQQIQLPRPCHALRAALHVQLAKDVAEVFLDRARGEHQFVRNFPIRFARGNKP